MNSILEKVLSITPDDKNDELNSSAHFKKEINAILNKLEKNEQIDAIVQMLKLTSSNEYRNIIRAIWMFRMKNPKIVNCAVNKIITSTDELKDHNLITFIFFHLNRSSQFELLSTILEKDKDKKLYNSDFLFRSYINNKNKSNNNALKESQELIDLINLTNKSELYSEIKRSQYNYINETKYSLEKKHIEKKKKILFNIMNSEDNSDFINALRKIRDSKNIAIVLKGPSIKRKKLGYLIDSHDLIIGVNNSDQNEHEKFGSRKDIHFYAPFLKNTVNKTPKGKDVIFCDTLDSTENKKIKSILNEISYQSATTGFSVILLTLLISTGHVSIFGFDSYSVPKSMLINSDISEKEKIEEGRNFAAPSHDIDYEHWFIHNYCRDILFRDQLVIL